MKNGLVVDNDGSKKWYKNGKLHRTDGPAAEWVDGTKCWYLNSERHRTDGPAIELANGTRKWCINDTLHRTDGPAIEYADGTKRWYVNGNQPTSTKAFQKAAKLTDEEMMMLVLKYGNIS